MCQPQLKERYKCDGVTDVFFGVIILFYAVALVVVVIIRIFSVRDIENMESCVIVEIFWVLLVRFLWRYLSYLSASAYECPAVYMTIGCGHLIKSMVRNYYVAM